MGRSSAVAEGEQVVMLICLVGLVVQLRTVVAYARIHKKPKIKTLRVHRTHTCSGSVRIGKIVSRQYVHSG